jgi:hypothetical protein
VDQQLCWVEIPTAIHAGWHDFELAPLVIEMPKRLNASEA